MFNSLPWPSEPKSNQSNQWFHFGTNICLDFHGDPLSAQLVVFSDGNHHMALADVVETFQQQNNISIFYATTPPGVLLNLIKQGYIQMGNLQLSRQPHVFISPDFIMQKLVDSGAFESFKPFMRSRGNVLLIKKSNSKNIQDCRDLLRDDVRLFLSNPHTEKASYQNYRASILAMAKQLGLDEQQFIIRLEEDHPLMTYGEQIHHREAPQAIYTNKADVAIVYSHLALRYTRIFPDDFSFVPFTGMNNDPEKEVGNLQTCYFINAMNDAGEYGHQFVEYCMSDEVTDIYQYHGLKRPE